MTPTILALAIAPPVALLVGVLCGWLLGRRAEAHAHALYVEGHERAHAHAIDLREASGGPCWVRGQVGAPLADPQGGPPPTAVK